MTDEEFDNKLDTYPTSMIIEKLLDRLEKQFPEYNHDKIVYHLERALKATEVKEPKFN